MTGNNFNFLLENKKIVILKITTKTGNLFLLPWPIFQDLLETEYEKFVDAKIPTDTLPLMINYQSLNRTLIFQFSFYMPFN